MCLKHTTEKELLEEVNKRIEEGKIKWSFAYRYYEDITEMRMICKNDDDWTLAFYQKTDIEKGYWYRQIYKSVTEPITIKQEDEKIKNWMREHYDERFIKGKE
ncbi:protein of unknown function [endosymbiont DhMRE of Dentiscutata heterogama]|uniref:hypothetical protein n=1 Tax=endosymbiont DhMRE of Dentiscutata heterogama TaxID=1609546 RepID=UPI000629DB88|nr:hypothetical protein [endosymbiont DhMRE of Dentiscutata heterogama]CFW93399.1 protein of unknown function [endosymbiont DhMRE of Dentiscutata heterogama]